MMITIDDINIKLFTRVTITDYGIKFEHFDKEGFESKDAMFKICNFLNIPEKCGINKNMLMPLFIIAVHLLKNGSINISSKINNHLTTEQLDEIHRMSRIIRGRNVEN